MAISVVPVRILLTALLLTLAACTTMNRPPIVSGPGPRFQAPDGRPIEAVAIGENVQVGATGLIPGRGYEFDLFLGDRRVGFARAAADMRGGISPLILLYQSGVIGCSGNWEVESRRRPIAFRDFDEAERALAGRTFRIELREADRESLQVRAALRPSRSRALASIAVPATRSAEPMVFPSTAAGCLLNSAEAGSADMHVSGRGFRPGETIQLVVAPNQVEWHVGDRIEDRAAAQEPVTARAGADGRFTTRVWDRARQQRGAYDIIARRIDLAGPIRAGGGIHQRDIISFNLDTAYILFLYYPPGGTQMDIAGRKIPGHPWFEFADSFATTGDDVWGGVDPTYVMPGHPGGTFAAYTVVQHRPANGPGSWANTTNLVDVSGAIEVGPVKAGCINGTYQKIWGGNHPVGDYDVVVNFGSVPANTLGAFVNDNNYNAGLDYLDGAIQVGFVVAEDPYLVAPTPAGFAVGQTSYSLDDVLTIPAVSTYQGVAVNVPRVDLRAVVRYPATAAGVDTPVAAGSHPIFIMQHGNHSVCNVAVADSSKVHTLCPVASRKRNHEGYMHLLDVLASRGIIAVSVDAFDLTGVSSQWIPERADLNLFHLEFWSQLNNPATYASYGPFATQTNMANRFNNHVDMTRVSVSGHSRGGEASVSTYVRNLARPAAQQFGIDSVSSIAPVDGVNGYVLGNVPYFVILPSADGDVSSLAGARIYDRAGTATNQIVKSGIDVYGANHNFFNTVWAVDGEEGGADSPRPDELTAAQQQPIGESYIAAFVLSTLRGMTVYEDMLRGRLRFPTLSGRKIYHFRHETPFLALDNGTSVTPVASGLTAPSTAAVSVHQTSAKRIGWTANGQTLTYGLAPTDVSGFEVLSFRAAQTNSVANPPTGNVEFELRLMSGARTQFVYTGRFFPIPRPYDRPSWPTDQNVMNTVRVPLHSFILNAVAANRVDLTAIDTVRLTFFTSQGEIFVDDIEFSR